VAVLSLAACTTDSSRGSAGSSPAASPATTEAAEADPDRVALDRAVAITTGLLAQLAKPGIDPGGRFAALHTAHLAALDRAAGPSASAAPTPGRALPALPGPRALRKHELAAQRELAHLAREAASGALARLLACMSAGIAAHLSGSP
jgi:hypothetical protein